MVASSSGELLLGRPVRPGPLELCRSDGPGSQCRLGRVLSGRAHATGDLLVRDLQQRRRCHQPLDSRLRAGTRIEPPPFRLPVTPRRRFLRARTLGQANGGLPVLSVDGRRDSLASPPDRSRHGSGLARDALGPALLPSDPASLSGTPCLPRGGGAAAHPALSSPNRVGSSPSGSERGRSSVGSTCTFPFRCTLGSCFRRPLSPRGCGRH